jgi:hypothetical protein
LVVVLAALCVLADRGVGADDLSTAVKPTRGVSPRVAELLSAAAPKFALPVEIRGESASAGETSATRPRLAGAEGATPANAIVRLPDYIVIERKPRPLPKTEDVLVPRELEKVAMREFLGDEDGFDRGVLNLFTLAGFWKKVPLLGRVSIRDFETNEERAMRVYRADRKAKALAELMSLMSVHEKAAPVTSTQPVRPRQSD